jgi:hypothetical protein
MDPDRGARAGAPLDAAGKRQRAGRRAIAVALDFGGEFLVADRQKIRRK